MTSLSDGSGDEICIDCGWVRAPCCKCDYDAIERSQEAATASIGRRCWCLWHVSDGIAIRQHDGTCPVHKSTADTTENYDRLRLAANSARVLIERHRATRGSNDLLTTALREIDEALNV